MAQMRINNAMRERAAFAVVVEKFEQKHKAALEGIRKEARDRHERLLGNWTNIIEKNEAQRFVSHTSTTHVELPINYTYKGLTGIRAKKLPGYYIHLQVELDRPLATATNMRELSKDLRRINLDARIAEFISLDKQARECYTNVLSFLKQFRTYERAQEEWQDLARYLPRTEPEAKGKKTETALILSGQSLNKYLKNV